jgi:outer membrane protein assembly factor BamB
VKLDEPPSAPPTYSKGRLYVPGQKGHVHVLDATTGEILWRFDAKARVTAAPVIDNGTIYVVTAAGTLIAVQE